MELNPKTKTTMQTLKQGKLWVGVKNNEACTLPRYVTQSTLQFTLNTTAIRLEVLDPDEVMTEQLLNSFVGKYVFAKDNSTSEIRLITSVETAEGTHNTYFIIIDEPFAHPTVGDYALNLADPYDYEPLYGVYNTSSTTMTIDGVAYPKKKTFMSFENTGPQKPIVVYGDGEYRITNSNNLTALVV